MNRTFFAFTVCAACAASPAAPRPTSTPNSTSETMPLPPSVKDVSSELEPVRVAGKLPALAGAVFRGGELVAIGATGFQKDGSDARIGTDAAWHLGSDTKAMTAVLIAIYIDRGKLHFEDTIGALFGAGVNAAFANVTIEQVLQHRGGLPHQFPPDIWRTMWRDANDPKTREAAVRAVLARDPTQAPGTYEYANTGYVTLGVILEHVSGKKWEDVIRAELFAPLGMTRCGFGAPRGARDPWGHTRDGASLVPMPPDSPMADNPAPNAPAGGVHCTLEDWGKFTSVVLKGVRGEKTIASPETMKRLLTPPENAKTGEAYAGGWVSLDRPWGGGRVLMHSGSNTMWTVTAWIAPEKNFIMLGATNVDAHRELDAVFPVLGAHAK